MLNDRNLENVFRQLSQGDILAEKLEEYKQYDARKLSANSAGNKNRFVIKEDYPDSYCSSGGFTFRNELVTESWITGGRSCSTGTARDDSPRSYKAILRLTNGETVNLERDSMQVLEKMGLRLVMQRKDYLPIYASNTGIGL